jgi:hypothetical protein
MCKHLVQLFGTDFRSVACNFTDYVVIDTLKSIQHIEQVHASYIHASRTPCFERTVYFFFYSIHVFNDAALLFT